MRMRIVAAVLALGSLACGQDPGTWETLPNGNQLRVVASDELTATAVVVAIPNPFCADAGEERVLGQAIALVREAQLAGRFPREVALGSEVLDSITLYHVVLPNTQSPETMRAWWDTLTKVPELPRDQDLLALAAARAALVADDEEALLPGRVLQSRARRVLAGVTVGGCSHAGSPRLAQQLTPEAFAKVLAKPFSAPVQALVLGNPAVGAVLRERLAASAVKVVPRRYADAGPGPEFGSNDRILGPFAAYAVRAPEPQPASLPFAVAVEIVRQRAQAMFGTYRYGEMQAGAPFVDYTFLAADPVCMLHRRGKNGARTEAPKVELRELLGRLDLEPFQKAETDAAIALLQREWAVPPFAPLLMQSLRLSAAGLVPRARALLLLGRHGIADAMVQSLDKVDAAAARAAWKTAIGNGAVWLGLEPASRGPDLLPDR